jgi:hyperosmotically inducible protein
LGLVLVVLVGLFLLGYRPGSGGTVLVQPPSAPLGGSIDTEQARERAAALGKKAATAAESVRDSVNEAGLTAKIKAKMALDDTVKATAIEVTTVGSTVTLAGRVSSAKEHDRAVALARETDGVTRVVDNLQVRN